MPCLGMVRATLPVIGVSGMSAHSPSVRAMMKQIRDEGAKALFLAGRTPSLHIAASRDIDLDVLEDRGRRDALPRDAR